LVVSDVASDSDYDFVNRIEVPFDNDKRRPPATALIGVTSDGT